MWVCRSCHEKLDDEMVRCWHCGTEKEKNMVMDGEENIEFEKGDNRYPALRIISGFYRFLAICSGLVFFVFSIYMAREEQNPMLFLGYILVGLIVVIMFLSISEIIKVFLDIEYNTR